MISRLPTGPVRVSTLNRHDRVHPFRTRNWEVRGKMLLTEGIRVRSIIGRFLEHSRIFHFAAGHEDQVQGDFLIGCADYMYYGYSRRLYASAVRFKDRPPLLSLADELVKKKTE